MDGVVVNSTNNPTFYRHLFGELTSTLDVVIVNEWLKTKVKKFEVIKMSSLVDKNDPETRPAYFHLPIKCVFEMDHKPKKQILSFHSSYLYEKANWTEFVAKAE